MTLDQQIKIVGLMATSSAAILEKIHAGDILGAQLEAENLQTEAQDWAWHVANEARQRGPRMTEHESGLALYALRRLLNTSAVVETVDDDVTVNVTREAYDFAYATVNSLSR